MPAVTLLRRADNKANPTQVPESDTGLLAGLELSSAGTATLYTDANTTAITIGSSGITTTVASELRVDLAISGTDDGSGITLGHVPTGSTTGSAPQLVNVTTTERDNLVGANGMLVYNTTTGKPQVFDGSWQDFPVVGGAAGENRQVVHVREEQTTGTAGGGATSGSWETRVLNTEVTDTGADATLSSNQITLTTGTYEVYVRAPAHRVDGHKIRFQNVTDASTVIEGANSQADSGLTTNHNFAFLHTRFTIASNKAFEVQHRGETTRATDGYGLAASLGSQEVYTEVWLFKIEDGVNALTLPGSSTDNAIVRWDGGGADILADSGITISDTNVVAIPTAGAINGTAELTLAALGGVMDLDATGVLSINSSAGAINIGDDAVAQAISIGTGAAARTISIGTGAAAMSVTLGSTNTTSALTLQSGTGAMLLTAGGIFDVNATGAVTIDGTSIDLTATAASSFSVSGASLDLTLDSAAGRVVIDGGEAVGDAVNLVASNASGGIALQAGSGGYGIGDADTAIQTNDLFTGGTGAKTNTIGSTASTSSLTLQGGTGAVTITQAGGDAITVGQTGGSGTGSTLGLPSFTTAERDANLTATNGMAIYNSTLARVQVYQGGAWDTMSDTSQVGDTMRFVVNGKPTATTTVDGAWIAPRAGTFSRITLYRRTAGGGSSTIVDVNKNGTTVYTTQGNRPTVTAAGGNDGIDATTDFDVTTFAQDDRIEVDVDQVESGNPQDVTVVIEVQYT